MNPKRNYYMGPVDNDPSARASSHALHAAELVCCLLGGFSVRDEAGS